MTQGTKKKARPEPLTIRDLYTFDMLTERQIQEMFGISDTKVRGWFGGYRRFGPNVKPFRVALRHFKDGDMRIVLREWLIEFFVANSVLVDVPEGTDDDDAMA